jgi:glycosyltransferase involved in cell wall biosynthesis
VEVSVIIPIYNAEPFLNRSIESALKQKQTSELLLIDDRSIDGSLEICKKWEKLDMRVKVYINLGNKGAGAARNLGIQNSKFDFIAFLDADDYFLDGRFENDDHLFKNNPEIDVVANALLIITSDSKTSFSVNSQYHHNSTFGFTPSFSKITINNLKYGNAFSIIGLTIKKSVFEKIGYFDEALKQCQDTDMNQRLVLETYVCSGDFDNPVVVYYRHETNSTKNKNEAIYYRRLASKKYFNRAINKNLDSSLILKYFKDFMEYDYLWIFKNTTCCKKLLKFILIPIFLIRITIKYNPPFFNKN